MKKIYLLFVVLSVFPFNANSLNINTEKELEQLEKALSNRSVIEGLKRTHIDSLSRAAAFDPRPYETYKKLYKEYRSYNYDTALFYVRMMEQEAAPKQTAEVQLCRAFVYLSGGLFKEASDIIENWQSDDSALQLDYYITSARLYWDLADNTSNELSAAYNEDGLRANRALQRYLTGSDTAMYWYYLGVNDLREGHYMRSIERCLKSLSAPQPSIHYQAMTASTLAYLYRLTGDNDRALHYYIEAAICDIQSSTYEAVAMRNIAELLFAAGEIDLADRYIRLAMKDAQFYHARHRQVSIAQSLPIIEERMFNRLKRQQHIAYMLLAIAAALFAGGIAGLIFLIRKNRAFRDAQQTIASMNQSLLEANKLKEELLGTLLASRSQFIAAVQQYQQDVRQNAANRKWSELMTVPKAADARQQRLVLDHQIDTIFLSLYPTFVKDMNAILRPEEQIILKKGELLNVQLRIFALIRLGITHNEIIAQILDYSVNTVYSYKTRVIASSDLSAEAFYTALMHIPSFSH